MIELKSISALVVAIIVLSTPVADKNMPKIGSLGYIEDLTIESFYGNWEEVGMIWFNENYFANPQMQEEFREIINNPRKIPLIFELSQNEFKYKDLSDGYEFSIENPEYRFYYTNIDEWYGYIPVIEFLKEFIEIHDDESIRTLLVNDKVLKDKMESGEIDWYRVPSHFFIIVDEDTLFLTCDFYTLYKLKRL